VIRNKFRQLLASNRGRGRFGVQSKGAEATIYLYDFIVDSEDDARWMGGVSAESFAKEVAALDVATIHLRVNSPGGSVFGGRVMENALRQHKARVIAHVDGLAASAASVVIMGADEIEMADGAFLMIHKAWTIAIGNADDLLHEAGVLEQIDGTLAQTYAKRTGIDAAKIADMLAAETWIEAGAAVEQGFADRVAGDDKEAAAPAANAWDLSAFNHAPQPQPQQQAAPQPPQQPLQAAPQPLQAAPQPAPLQPPQPDRAALQRAVLARLIPA